MPEVKNLETLLTGDEVATFLKVAPGTLANWRITKREQLPFTKVGGLVRYRLADVKRFVEANRSKGGAK